jgi:hypothetical protein
MKVENINQQNFLVFHTVGYSGGLFRISKSEFKYGQNTKLSIGRPVYWDEKAQRLVFRKTPLRVGRLHRWDEKYFDVGITW